MNYTIIQPGRIGDILICLPIARYAGLQGYTVHWPICASYHPMFSRAVDYVRWIPVTVDPRGWVDESRRHAKNLGGTVIDLSFGLPGQEDAWRKWRESGVNFDKYKYAIAGVSFEAKWTLKIRRDHAREEILWERVTPRAPYVAYQERTSDSFGNIVWKPDEAELAKVEIRPVTDSVFDWIAVLERAKKLVLVDSCMVNLVEGLGIRTPRRRLRKNGYVLEHDYPVLREGWEQ